MMINKHRYFILALYIGVFAQWHNVSAEDMVNIAGGTYTPLFKNNNGPSTITVKAFYIEPYLVTNRQFQAFIQRYPKWQKDKIKPIFSDANYLKHLTPETLKEVAERPVTNVSWFSARAYCKSLDKRLPTVNEWEFVGKASNTSINGSDDPGYLQQILDWYARPATDELPNVHDTEANYWQVYGMHGVVWEMVNDFNTALITGESRADSQLDKQLYCGAGAASAIDPGDYAAFMRYALRSSYQASYTMESLGFRCAKDAPDSLAQTPTK